MSLRALLMLLWATGARAWFFTWARGNWQPSPQANGEWKGQSQMCTEHYAQQATSVLEKYKSSACLSAQRTWDYLAKEGVSVIREPSAQACAKQCFAEFTHSLSGHGGGDPVASSVPDIPKDSEEYGDLPLKSLSVLYAPATTGCYCAGPENLSELIDDAGQCDAGFVWYAIPLGCLFTHESACREADRDSCVWESRSENLGGGGCCVDATGWEWIDGPCPPATCLIGLTSVLAICTVLIVFQFFSMRAARNRARGNELKLDTELISKHKERYEAYLATLVVRSPSNSASQTCAICLSSLADGKCARFPCGHVLHYKCMKDYVEFEIGKSHKRHPVCPVCRQKIEPPADLSTKDSRPGVIDVVVPERREDRREARRDAPANSTSSRPPPPDMVGVTRVETCDSTDFTEVSDIIGMDAEARARADVSTQTNPLSPVRPLALTCPNGLDLSRFTPPLRQPPPAIQTSLRVRRNVGNPITIPAPIAERDQLVQIINEVDELLERGDDSEGAALVSPATRPQRRSTKTKEQAKMCDQIDL
eukprot:TRINITY_DN11560_c0_g1_i1.p1 TRINITY_DN11560_c0_g1~~TRINITY_DN11560_c0_g1_i1.p1  ORF type:complete len:557 (+),score=91.87 TRINITY_DN11560_c0_g1_i1:64-1671(+)